ncbi:MULTISPECIES: REP-associated tyrosine transposase [Rhodonellum]|nr:MULTISPECIES: transposase [Rhodonellum]
MKLSIGKSPIFGCSRKYTLYARRGIPLRLPIFGICNSSIFYVIKVMGEAYQIRDQETPYFLTFQVVGWADVFSRKCYRDIILESLNYCRKEKGMYLFGYVIMTNHLHLIIQQKNGDLSGLVRDFKKFTSKSLLKAVKENPQESRKEWLEMIFGYHAKFNKRSGLKQFWTHENHAVELYRAEVLESRLKYIHENPVRAGWVESPEDYLYSSARNYSGLSGLIEIDFY